MAMSEKVAGLRLPRKDYELCNSPSASRRHILGFQGPAGVGVPNKTSGLMKLSELTLLEGPEVILLVS